MKPFCLECGSDAEYRTSVDGNEFSLCRDHAIEAYHVHSLEVEPIDVD